MTRCDRFEKEGLLMLEQGASLGPHFSECKDCRMGEKAYQIIKSELRNMQHQTKAPDGWQSRVWQTIEQRERNNGRHWRRALLPIAASLAGAVFIFSLLLPASHEVSFNVSIEKSAAITRGANARPGDSLLIDASLGTAKLADILVYRNDRSVIFRCSATPACVRNGQRISAKVVLTGIGSYQPVLILSESVLPELTNHLDEDARLILESGAKIKLAGHVSVY